MTLTAVELSAAAIDGSGNQSANGSLMKVKVYGADWCPMTQNTIEHLQRRGVRYEYINVEEDAAARRWVREQNHGKEKKPTVDIDGRILAEPSEEELDELLATGRRP